MSVTIQIGCKELVIMPSGILIKREGGARFIVKSTITQILLDDSDSCLQVITAIVDNKEQVPLAIFHNKKEGDPREVYMTILETLWT